MRKPLSAGFVVAVALQPGARRAGAAHAVSPVVIVELKPAVQTRQ